MNYKKFIGIFKSMRTWVNAKIIVILGLMSAMPEDVKMIMGQVIGDDWVNAHWKFMVSIVAISGVLMHGVGSVRKGSEIPLEER